MNTIDHTNKLKAALNEEFVDKEIDIVRSILMRILSYESRACKENGYYDWARPFKKELKSRRLLIAKYYQSKGGQISTAVLDNELPSDEVWPGLVRLVETDGFEIYKA